MYWCYQVIIGLVFWLTFPVLLLVVLITGRHRRGLAERLGWYRLAKQRQNRSIIWLHAASIGEITVARTLIEQVQRLAPEASFVVTTMTIHGRDYARSLLPESQPVYLAPLDVPGVTDRVVRLIRPSVYVCLETELWPLVLGKVKRFGATVLLLNGRLSERSIDSYRRFRIFFKRVLDNYDHIAVIGEQDRQRFLSLGVRPEMVSVTGNVKEDWAMIRDPEAVRDRWQRRLHVGTGVQVFVAGSTHDPEEALLLPLIGRLLQAERICLLAPRHPKRLPQIESLCAEHRLPFDLLSDLKRGQDRRHPLILVDTLGDLAELYSIADSAFIGGSLVDYGGHNMMEAARWDCVVFFGPSTEDFQEAAAALERSGGGIRVDSPEDLEGRLQQVLGDHRERARRAAEAGRVARRQSGATDRQATLVAAAFGKQREL